MLKRIRRFFLDQNSKIDLINQELKCMNHHLNNIHQHQREMYSGRDDVKKDLAAILKRVSSIEMELLISRGACLDNNFEGKEDM